MIPVTNRFDSAKEHARQEPATQLPRDQKGDFREDSAQDQPVGPAVAMKTDEENGPALEIRQTLRVNEPDTVKIDPPDEPVQDSMPKLDDARHDEEIAPSMHPPTL